MKLFAFKLGVLRIILFIIIIISSSYVVYSIFYEERYSFEEENPIEQTSKGASKNLYLRQQNDYSFFLKEIGKMNIFSASSLGQPYDSGIDNEKINKIKDNLRLVGIISVEPKKVIIEDKRRRESFYLKEGEVFLENIEVESIGKKSVILNYYGQDLELYL